MPIHEHVLIFFPQGPKLYLSNELSLSTFQMIAPLLEDTHSTNFSSNSLFKVKANNYPSKISSCLGKRFRGGELRRNYSGNTQCTFLD